MDIISYQQRIRTWLQRVLGDEVRTNRAERAARLVEEAIELAQVEGVELDGIDRIAKRVYRRPVGEASQEVAGVAVCLLAFADATSIDLNAVTGKEIARIEQVPAEKIRARHNAKAADGTALEAK